MRCYIFKVPKEAGLGVKVCWAYFGCVEVELLLLRWTVLIQF